MKSERKVNTQNQQSKIIILWLLGLLVFVAGWVSFRVSTQRIPTVLSLKDNWDSLEMSAHNVQSDAYLTNVAISLNRKSPYIISAEYHSTSAPDKMIFVGIDSFNEIDSIWIDVPSSSSGAQKPIYRNDWTIDSQDALFIFAKDETINTCLKSSKSSIGMSLNRVMTESSSWVLNIIDCPEEGKFKAYYLNAQTGELFDPLNQ